jgi:hypothetical protein
MKKKRIDAAQTTLEIRNEVVNELDSVLRRLNSGSKKVHPIKQPIKEETPEPFEMWCCRECSSPCPRPLSFCSKTCLQKYKIKH